MNNIYKAMLDVQGRVGGAQRDSKNTHFKNSYASLTSVWHALRGPLQDAGLVVLQFPGEVVDGTLHLRTVIAHAESGETIENTTHVYVSKSDAQGVGSAITYAQRYALMAIFGLPPVDDDGEAARVAAEPPALIENAPSGLRKWYSENARKVDPNYVQWAMHLWPSVEAIKAGIEMGELDKAAEAWFEMEDDEKRAIWLAPTKGGVFTTAERDMIKSTEFREAYSPEAA